MTRSWSPIYRKQPWIPPLYGLSCQHIPRRLRCPMQLVWYLLDISWMPPISHGLRIWSCFGPPWTQWVWLRWSTQFRSCHGLDLQFRWPFPFLGLSLSWTWSFTDGDHGQTSPYLEWRTAHVPDGSFFWLLSLFIFALVSVASLFVCNGWLIAIDYFGVVVNHWGSLRAVIIVHYL